jgi:acetyltransferase-like isoleucine patch superfamily enzyme
MSALKRAFALAAKLFICLLPWGIKRRALKQFFAYDLHPAARIGLAWVYPKHLRMAAEARIDHFTIAIHLDAIEMENHATIGRNNWITGFPSGSPKHFAHQKSRQPRLILGEHSAITKNHHLDCTEEIKIGRFTTVAGYQSQFLTHSIDIAAGRQHSERIDIGDYCFVSTRCIVLGGAQLPSQSVLAAGAVLNKAFEAPFSLYGGVPAKFIKEIAKDARYFHRAVGYTE